MQDTLILLSIFVLATLIFGIVVLLIVAYKKPREIFIVKDQNGNRLNGVPFYIKKGQY